MKHAPAQFFQLRYFRERVFRSLRRGASVAGALLLFALAGEADAQEKFALFNRAAPAPGGTTGCLVYSTSGAATLGCLTGGTNGYILKANGAGSAPSYVDPNGFLTGFIKLQSPGPGSAQTGGFNVNDSSQVGTPFIVQHASSGLTGTQTLAEFLNNSAATNSYHEIQWGANFRQYEWVPSGGYDPVIGWYKTGSNREYGLMFHQHGPGQFGVCLNMDAVASTYCSANSNGGLMIGVNGTTSSVGFFVDSGGNLTTLSGKTFGVWPGVTANAILTTNGTGNFVWVPTSTYGAGTVTSVNISGGTTGLSFGGGPITSSGTFTVAGTLAVANGGTGGTSRTAGFNNLAPASPSKGDILCFNGTDWVKLTVGTNAYVLTADSTASCGVKWDVTAGSGTVTSISTTAPITGCSSPCTSTASIGISPFAGSGAGAVPSAAGAPAGSYLDKSGNWTQPAGSFSSPLTTKGDLHGYSTGDTRVAVDATDGKFLKSDSSNAKGVSYDYAKYGTLRVLKETVFAGITPASYSNGSTTTIDGSGYTATVAGNGAIDMVAAGLRLRQGTTSSTNFQIMKISAGNTGDFNSFFTEERFRRSGEPWAVWVRIASYDYTNTSGIVYGIIDFATPKWGGRMGRLRNALGAPNTTTGGLAYDYWWNGGVNNSSSYSSIGVSSNDVMAWVYRTPTLADIYVGTYSGGWPALGSMTKVGTFNPMANTAFMTNAAADIGATNFAITFLVGGSAATSGTYEIIFDRWRVTTWE